MDMYASPSAAADRDNQAEGGTRCGQEDFGEEQGVSGEVDNEELVKLLFLERQFIWNCLYMDDLSIHARKVRLKHVTA